MDAPGPRLESILGHCERHTLLHMAPKWFDHWTTWAGLNRLVIGYFGLEYFRQSTAASIDKL